MYRIVLDSLRGSENSFFTKSSLMQGTRYGRIKVFSLYPHQLLILRCAVRDLFNNFFNNCLNANFLLMEIVYFNLMILFLDQNLSIIMSVSSKRLNCGACFIKQTRSRTHTFRKSGPWTFRKNGPYAKIDCIG